MKPLLILLAVFIANTSFSQSKKYYRKAYQTVFGEYVGVYPLDAKDTLETNHLTFSYGGNGKLESIESRASKTGEFVYSDYINALKIGLEHTDSSFIVRNYVITWEDQMVTTNQSIEFIHDLKGKVIRSVERNFDEEIPMESFGVLVFEYQGASTVILKPEGEFPYNGLYQSASQINLKLNKLKLIAEEIIHYANENGENVAEDERYVYEYDDFGNLVSKKSYDVNGMLEGSFFNCAYTRYSYDQNGFESTVVMFNAEDQKTDYTSTEYLEDGSFLEFIYPCETRYIYDKSGNILSEKYFYSDGKPAKNTNGIHEYLNEFDANSTTWTYRYYDTNHALVDGGEGYAGKQVQFDAQGRVLKEYFFDKEKNILPNADGSYIVQFNYEDQNNLRSVLLFDAENKPMLDHSGAHAYEITTDEYGYESISVFGFNNEYLGYDQGVNWEGSEIVRTLYLEDDLTIKSISYFSNTDMFKTTNSEGYFCKEFNYDTNGNLEEINYLDENLNLVNAHFGEVAYAQIRYKYNDQLDEIESSFFDAEGNRTINESMISIYRTSYTQNGLEQQLDRYSADEKLLNQSISYATVKYIYDQDENVINESYYTDKGGLWSDSQGIAIYISEFKNGLLVSAKYMNAENKPTMNAEGVYHLQNTYTADGNIAESVFLNAKGKKMNAKNGVCRIVYGYAGANNVSVIELFDRKGKHALGDPLGHGLEYSKIIYQYDEDGNYSDTIYYDLKGQVKEYGEYY